MCIAGVYLTFSTINGSSYISQTRQSMILHTSFPKHPKLTWRELHLTSSQQSSPNRRISVVKKPQRRKHNLIRNPFSKAAIGAPRWTLSENMTDILTGQRFRHVEADEMLTPDRIVPVSGEATTHALDLTPVSDLVSRDISKQDLVTGNDGSIGSVNDQSNSSPENPSQLPPRNPARLGGKAVQKLPSPPEIMVTTADKTQIEPLSDVLALEATNMGRKRKDRCVYLKSTPYTLTQPSFRHGPITLSLAEVGRGAKTMDDTADWTAFQMATLGGAEDFFEDTSSEEDTKQLEEITSWFDRFGFETYGELITEDVPESEFEPVPSMRSSSHSTFSSTHSTMSNDSDLPIPVGAEFPSGFWNAPAPGQVLDKAKFFNSTGLKRWVGEGGPKRPSFYSSEESPPPSPMMQLMVHMDDGGAAVSDTVPMGYNLGHDLGDFLKWQAENIVCV